MIEECHHDVIDAIGNVLHDSRKHPAELLEPMLFMLADVMSQATDRINDAELAQDVVDMLLRCYEFHCNFEDEDQVVQ
jgi:hypothetical protein